MDTGVANKFIIILPWSISLQESEMCISSKVNPFALNHLRKTKKSGQWQIYVIIHFCRGSLQFNLNVLDADHKSWELGKGTSLTFNKLLFIGLWILNDLMPFDNKRFFSLFPALLEYGNPNYVWSDPKSSQNDVCSGTIIMRFFGGFYGGGRGIRPIGLIHSFMLLL